MDRSGFGNMRSQFDGPTARRRDRPRPRKSRPPLTRQLYEQLRSAIADGRRRRGHRLPSGRMLAGQLEVSRNTVSAAIDQLAQPRVTSISHAAAAPSIAPGLVRPPVAGMWGTGSAVCDPCASAALGLGTAASGQSNWPFRPRQLARPSPVLSGIGRRASVSARHLGALPAPVAARHARARDTPTSPTIRRCSSPWPRYLTEHRGVRTEPRQVMVTPSAQAAIALIARVTLEAGDVAWLESPGYGGARVALEAVGAHAWSECPSTAAAWRSSWPHGQAPADLCHAFPPIPDRQVDADRPPARAAAFL